MGLIILTWIVALVLIGGCTVGAVYFFNDYESSKIKILLGFISIGIGVIVIASAIFVTTPLTKTESFKRFSKSLESEFQGGITREIVVYSEGGTEIYRESGKFDVEHTNDRLKWVDEDGHVQIIYLGRSSTAVVNEIGDVSNDR